ncbi:deoxyribodipyrimidine photo-lyase [Wenzhouxiangella sp. XN201]|uniref:cryptochrome/photolyase family protein n=1 Tax=Wenzhouxiangella sp. XN201 TaxID=2710755 RepID=UPI0013C77D73|nr:deoxyribodipyrimidine photo-lyase [Wenzhouxiangella sp. XN201]NEZ03361.1 deoxyribodipyrimidine photo-lyase [Wenzhouxiangella sp. XN201]
MTDTAIVWFRRDLRLADNPALDNARRHHARVVPLFVHDPEAEAPWSPGSASRWWLHHSLVELDGRLRHRGSRLIVARGDPLEAIERVRQVTGAEAVCWNRCYEKGAVERDREIKQRLHENGLTVRSFNGSLLVEPWNGTKADGEPYRVFTPFWKQVQKRWMPLVQHVEPRDLQAPARWPASLEIDELELQPDHHWPEKLTAHWSPGELGARRRLEDFAERALEYHAARDRPDQTGTSRLSPHLHFGEISPGQVIRALEPSGELPGGKGRMVFASELAWREFSYHLLWHFPQTSDESLKEGFRAFPWRERDDYASDLAAWQRGRTGIPMVDAGMRELWETGWMHNRVRMIVASFLTKNLLIPWQEGARWFWDTLVDADLANNTQGWQWTAGCGADAAPYFRVFNPVLQGEKFDPHGDYVRRWCPELARQDANRIHHPLAPDEAKSFGYPEPIVDLKATRRRALDAWNSIR